MDRPEERLALIEVLEREGQPARLVDVHAWPVSIGRALSNTLVLDDPEVAARHAWLDVDAEGRVALTVGLSRNGVQVDGKNLPAGEPVVLPPGGARWRMGSTRLRLRLPAEVLAPERPLRTSSTLGGVGLLAVGGALLAMEYGENALHLDPGADFSAWLPNLVGVPAVLAIWCAIWALLSKLFQHHFDFTGHLRIALPWSLLIGVVGVLCPLLGASLASPTLWRLSTPLEALGMALMIHAHLQHVLPARPRAVGWAVAAMALLATGVSTAMTWRSSDSWSASPYMSALPLPALRLAGTVSPEQLLADMKPLADRLTQRARKARDEDREEGRDDAGAAEE